MHGGRDGDMHTNANWLARVEERVSHNTAIRACLLVNARAFTLNN